MSCKRSVSAVSFCVSGSTRTRAWPLPMPLTHFAASLLLPAMEPRMRSFQSATRRSRTRLASQARTPAAHSQRKVMASG
eukprot:12147327-Alexandrium_andersonii.AAC.1